MASAVAIVHRSPTSFGLRPAFAPRNKSPNDDLETKANRGGDDRCVEKHGNECFPFGVLPGDNFLQQGPKEHEYRNHCARMEHDEQKGHFG